MDTNGETGTSGEVPGSDRPGSDRPGSEVPDGEIVDNPEMYRYELRHDGSVVGVVQYRIDGDIMTIPHVEVAGHLRGQGISGPFLDEVLARIEARGMKVVPSCGYAASHIAARPELRHLVA